MPFRFFCCLIALLGAAALSAQAPASPDTDWTPTGPFIQARERILHSEATGRDYRILLAVPETPPPPGGYPVLYLLDGHATFPLAAWIAQERSERGQVLGIDPGIIVGIEHLKTADDRNPRAHDFTPPAADLSATGDTSGDPQGGADRFMEFLERELRPLLAAEFATNPERQTLFGHSYGGLFTLHTLFTRPGLFQRYVAASPSIWWNDRYVLGERDTFTTNYLPAMDAQVRPQLLVTVGDQEQVPLVHHVQMGRADILTARRMVDNARELAEDLQAHCLPCTFYVFPNDNHGTTRIPAINQAIRFAFGK